MRPAVAIIAVAGLLFVPAAGAGETNVGVRADEFELLLSRSSVSPGRAEIEYTNQGEDPHDLQIRRKGDSKVRSIAELGPGQVGDIEFRLKRDSRYVMWCSTLNGEHRELGMEAELRVKKH